MVERQQFIDCTDGDNLLVGEHRDPVTNGVQRIEIMGDQEHRQPQSLLQFLGQAIERGRANRIQPCGSISG